MFELAILFESERLLASVLVKLAAIEKKIC